MEHVFETVKRSLGCTYFLIGGNESVKAESFMHLLAYSLKRAIRIKGATALVETINSNTLNILYY